MYRHRARSLLHSRPYIFAALLSGALLIANVIAEPNFGSPGNWPEELATLAPLAIVAMSATPAVLSGGGGLDLSVGPLAVLCNVLLVQTLIPNGVDTAWEAVPLLVGLGVLIGALKGVLVSVLRYEAVIATLCVAFVITGANLKIGEVSKSAPPNWTEQLVGSVGPIPGGLLLIAVPLLLWFALSRTAYHRSLYGVGGNDVTAFSAGINVHATRIIAYTLGGAMAALGGIALTALVQSSQASSTGYYILIALAAVTLGGTPLVGGRGGLVGSLLGALALFLTQTLMSALSVPPNWLNVIYGSMLILGVMLGGRILLLGPARADSSKAAVS